MAWRSAKVVARSDWSDGLFTLRLDVALDEFEPGQWVNLALDIDGERVKRSYSLASPPGRPLELFLVEVEGGALTPRLARLGIGDALWLDDVAHGFFTLRYVPDCRDLWLFATGTGLAPYLSMARSGALWTRFERVVLVHGARRVDDLAYRDELEQLAASRPALHYLPLITRQQADDVIRARITDALGSGVLEKACGVALVPERAHVMLCGNPAMVSDMQALLADRGLRKHRQRKPGHITAESYW
jgi:ferredoxin--NADP+ reductase